MTKIYYTEKSEPVYNEYGYIVGYDKVEEHSVIVADEYADEMLVRMSDYENLSLVKTTNIPE